MPEPASRGVANAGLTTGIIGTALSVLNGGLGSIFNNNGCCNNNGYYNNNGYCSDDHYVTRYEAKKDSVIAAKDSEIALLKSEQNTEIKIADIYERLEKQIRNLETKVNDNTCGQAVTNQQIIDNIKFVDSKFDGVYKDMRAGDEKVKCYVDCHFVPGKLVMPLDDICPPAMPLYEAKKATKTANN